jgi:hypothetical protein
VLQIEQGFLPAPDELCQPRYSWQLTLMGTTIAFAEGRRSVAEGLAADAEEIWGFDQAPDATRVCGCCRAA